ncbi:MAG: hypothetical protein HKN18_08515 [Silicimonas sp.]|nr:hypothetical protein [Silicimonas sp.]
MPKATLFSPANASVTWDEAEQLSRLTGLRPEVLATFKPHRLALHRCLIRVTAQLHVPDGPRYADLGLNLRAMASTIFERGVSPKLPEIEAAFTGLRKDAAVIVEDALQSLFRAEEKAIEKQGIIARLFGQKAAPPKPFDADATVTKRLAKLEADAAETDSLHAACLKSVVRVCNGVLSQRGGLRPADIPWVSTVAVNLVSNSKGDACVAALVDPLLDETVKRQGYNPLPPQSHPVVLNAKGASASGKSTIRGAQRQIADRLGLEWSSFAIISPDYWRKSLIDYNGLGDDFKYAAMLTGQELEIIDRKLDAFMADLGAKAAIPNLLIDRFRFDSFHLAEKRASDSRLLTRFGAKIYMFFLITPPEATVERAWLRGLETGRYKAVDDLLYHNIEAYSGMPDLFFSWANAKDRWVHYEFLDNSIPQGSPLRTVAAGRNGHLVVTDIDRFCDIERFRHVNVDAKSPGEVLEKSLGTKDAMAIARRACRELNGVDFLVPGTEIVFARSRDGAITVDVDNLPDHIPLDAFGKDAETGARLRAIDPEHLGEIIGTLESKPV